MKKGDLCTITITDHTTDGEGIGHVGAFALFVKDTVAGDTVECVVMKLKKTYGWAKLVRVITPSPDRIEARCDKARPCGGCQLQEMDYQATLRFKTERVRQNLKRIGGLDVPVLPCVGMEDPWRYRNKALIPFGKDRDGGIVAGFYAGRTHRIIEEEDCLLSPKEFSLITSVVREHLVRCKIPVYDEVSGTGLFRHLLIRKGFSTNEILAAAVINGKTLPKASELVAVLKDRLAELGLTLRSFSINRNETPGNVILSPDTTTVFGDGYVEDYIGPLKFRISPNSFFQVNPVMTAVLYEKALGFAGLTGRENVWDLYCGIGTISLFLAKKARRVYGVEIVPQAISDAKINAAANGLANTEFFVGRAETVLPEWASSHPDVPIDVIVTDPPREGCDERCLETMIALSPERIVYVSCNSATLARDLKVLTEAGYRVDRVQPVDMFPWTGHVETVVKLTRGIFR